MNSKIYSNSRVIQAQPTEPVVDFISSHILEQA